MSELFFVSPEKRDLTLFGILVPMETVSEPVNRKTELEEKISSLETERDSLLNDIVALKEKITTLDLEKAVNTLESEVEELRTEKAVLEEKAANYKGEESLQITSQTSEEIQA